MQSQELASLETRLLDPLPIPIIGQCLQKKAVAALAEDRSPEAVKLLAKAVTRLQEPEIKASILDTLSKLRKQNYIDIVCEVWVDTRNRDLANLLVKKEWTASAATACNVMLLSVLKTNRQDRFTLYYKSEEIAKFLFKAMKDEDPDIANRAIKLVNSFNDWDFQYGFPYPEKDLRYDLCLKWSETRDKFYEEIICKNKYVPPVSMYAPRGGDARDLFVLTALKTAQFELIQNAERDIVESLAKAYYDRDAEIANRAGKCELREPSQRALFYFLTEQWDKYENLDYEHSLLQKVYELADERIRKQIAEKARQSGRIEWIQIVAGGRGKSKRLGEMNDAEWEVTINILSKNEKWEQIWKLAQKAPTFRSKQLLQKLNQVAWLPRAEQERVGFEKLKHLAEECLEKIESNGSLMGLQETLRSNDNRIFFLNEEILASYYIKSSGSGTCNDKKIKLWQIPNSKCICTIYCHDWNCTSPSGLSNVAFSHDSKLLASHTYGKDAGKIGGIIELWKIPDYKKEISISGSFNNPLSTIRDVGSSINKIAFSPDSKILASCSEDKTIRLWQMPDGQPQATLIGHNKSINTIAFSPDGKILASCSEDKTIRLWQMPDGQPQATLIGHDNNIEAIAFSPDSKILASDSWDQTVKLWRIPDGQLLATLADSGNIAFSPDSKILASCDSSNQIKLWKIPDGQLLATLIGHDKRIDTIAFNLNGKILASCDGNQTIRLWQISDDQLLNTIDSPSDRVNYGANHIFSRFKISFSPDGKTLASGFEGEVMLWSSNLPRLLNQPVAQLNQENREFIEKALQNDKVTQEEKHWLEFMQALMNWRRRFDVLIDDSPLLISTGEFDIEIEG